MQNFYELFAAAAERFPDRVAIEVQRREGLESFTYRELRAHAEGVAAALAAAGITRGDRCCLLAGNDAHWCAAYLGILRIGAVAVPLDTAYKPPQIAALLRDSGARIVFTGARHLDEVREAVGLAASGARIVPLHDAPAPGVDPPPCPARGDDPAVILYTSGTTADPKGVVLTHRNLIAERTAAFDVVTVSERDCVLGVLPLFHALAQMANLLLPLSIGARVVFLESVNTTELLRALAGRGVTIFACVPQFYYLIHQRVTGEVARAGLPARTAFRVLLGLNRGLRHIGVNAGRLFFGRVHRVLGGRMRLMVTGGSRFDPAVGADLRALGLDILQAYGLTETSGAATLMRPGDPHLETVGHPLAGVDVRIARDEASASPGEGDGEVLIRGPIVMAGYYNRPDATAAALRDGWLHTGDLGRLDANGRLIITGRIKELIVLSSGKNIYPEEIEAHYRAAPVIGEICVVGMAAPGEPAAERLYAVVVPDEDVLRQRRVVNAGELVRFEMEGRSVALPPHKRVLGYEIWREPLPRTTTGKLKRFEIQRRLVRAPGTAGPRAITGEERRWLSEPGVAPIVAAIAGTVRNGPDVTPSASLELDLGLDSMERVELLTALEARFGAKVPDEVAERTFTVRELVDAILAHRGAADADEERGAWDTLLRPEAGAHAQSPPLRDRPIAGLLLYSALHALLLVARLVIRTDASGHHHLPAGGPLIISPNHQSYLDVFFVVGQLPYRLFRRLFFVGASEYFEGPLLQRLARLLHVVPIDPDASLVPAMQASAAGLRQGRVLILFPEGERSIDGTVRTFKKGGAILAHHLDVPVVPVALDGLFAIWPRSRPINWRLLRPWRRVRVAVRFGAPIAAEAEALAGAAGGHAPRAGTYAQTTARIRESVAGMWDEMHQA